MAKNKAINTFTYTGVVTLSQYIGSKKVQIAQVHNAGGASLFDFLADCLIGDTEIAQTKRPTKIKLIYHSKIDDVDYYESASGFIHLLVKPEKISEVNQSRVRYSFLISRDILANMSTSDDGTLGLGLYSHNALNLDSEVTNFAAYCELTGITADQISNAALVVDWELIIVNGNATKKSTN